jgi:hypothetical protein
MTDSDSEIEKLIEKIEQYGINTLELLKLKMLRRSIILFTGFTSYSAIFLAILFLILFLSIGFSLLLGECLGRLSYGFFIVAGGYFVVFIICYFFLHQWIKKPLANRIIQKVLNKK